MVSIMLIILSKINIHVTFICWQVFHKTGIIYNVCNTHMLTIYHSLFSKTTTGNKMSTGIWRSLGNVESKFWATCNTSLYLPNNWRAQKYFYNIISSCHRDGVCWSVIPIFQLLALITWNFCPMHQILYGVISLSRKTSLLTKFDKILKNRFWEKIF